MYLGLIKRSEKMKSLTQAIKTFEDRWFRESTMKNTSGNYEINERALRARAGIMLLASAFLLYTRLDHGMHNELVPGIVGMGHGHGMMGHDHGMTQLENQTFVPRVYSHTWVFIVLGFIIHEMITPMFVKTARYSITTQLGVWLTRNQTPIYTPMKPKVFAWGIGSMMAITCTGLVYAFDAYGYMSNLPLLLLSVCFSFMWLETAAGICAGCIVHQWLTRIGLIKTTCATCEL